MKKCFLSEESVFLVFRNTTGIRIKFYIVKLSTKFLDFARDHDASRLKSGAYTIVREHFEPACNTGVG